MNDMIIRPSRDLRNNYAELSRLCNDGDASIAVTVNGKQDTLLMGYDKYMREQAELTALRAKVRLYAELTQARDDVKLGRTENGDKVFDDLIDKLENL